MNSDNAEDELVHALLEPLGDEPDFTDTVRQMTGHARHRLPDTFPEACAETAAFFRTTKPPGSRGKSKLLLAALLGLAVGAAFFLPTAARQELKLLLVTQSGQLPFHGASAFYGTDVMRERILSRVSSADAEILFGDLSAENTEDRWKGLALREPKDPSRQADAALGYLRSNGIFPPDFVAKGEALDPGNGWYAYMQGIADSTREIGHNPSSTRGPNEILESSMLLLERAAAAPRFEDPAASPWRERLRLLPEEELWADVVAVAKFLKTEMPSDAYRLQPANGMAALIEVVDRERGVYDRSRMKRASQAWLATFERSLLACRTWDEMVIQIRIASSAGRSSARTLGMVLSIAGERDQPLVFRDLASQCHLVLLDADGSKPPSSLFARGNFPASSSGASLQQPGIDAEWAMHERLIGWGTVFLMTTLLAVNLVVLQSTRGQGRLAERLGQLLRRSDHAWIFAISLGLPLLLYLLGTRLPGHGILSQPLEGSKDPRFQLLAILHAAWVVTVPLLSLEATRWRLALRGKALGMAGRGLHLGMVPLAMALCSMTGAALLPSIPAVWAAPKLPLLGLAGGLVVAVLWLFGLILWHFAAPKESFPERLLRLQVVFWPVLAALLVTAAGMVGLRTYERHLVAINRFEKSPRIHNGNPTSADQAFMDIWKPKLLEEIRKAQVKFQELE